MCEVGGRKISVSIYDEDLFVMISLPSPSCFVSLQLTYGFCVERQRSGGGLTLQSVFTNFQQEDYVSYSKEQIAWIKRF